MDKKTPGKESPEDLTRESLIAISYRVPEGDLDTEKSSKNTDSEKVNQPLTRDGDEKYRSKLISISYSPLPDEKVRPLSTGELEG